MVFCKDCKHVNGTTLTEPEDAIICLKRSYECPIYLSPVTGETSIEKVAPNFCKYERALGFCQNGVCFEAK